MLSSDPVNEFDNAMTNQFTDLQGKEAIRYIQVSVSKKAFYSGK